MRTKWQCSKCGATTSTENGLRPPVGSYCAKSTDKKHRWSKVIAKTTRWQCTQCGATHTNNTGLRPPVGSYCSKSNDKKHRWRKN